MSVELLMVGSELVNGEKLDTNGQWLARRLGELGLEVRFFTLLGDRMDDNLDAFQRAIRRSQVVVTSGGLGPTQDDLTRDALAAAAGVPLVEHAESLEHIQAFFTRRNRPMTERNRLQAMFPQGAEPLVNRVGTAPGIWMAAGSSLVACLPGVPYELKIMFDEQVAPRLRAAGLASRVVVHRVVNLFGKGEAEIESMALDLTARDHEPAVGITASDATISFRLTASGRDEAEAQAIIEPLVRTIRDRFGILVLGEGTTDVPQALVLALRESGRTLATAESCTGGLIAQRLTTIPGVSAFYPGGVVSYSPDAKAALIDVDPQLVERHGVVSAEVARAMAEGVRRKLGADLAISTTGVAGPDGGTPETPVGLVYLGLATAAGSWSRRLELGSEQPRHVIQSRAAKHAMNWARRRLIAPAELD